MINLSSKSVLITGGSRGIGAACVKLFAEAGATVHFTYKSNVDAASKLALQFGKKKKVFFYKLDFSNEANLELRIIELVSKIKKIDVLINNAGIWEYGEADKMSLREWNRTMQANLTSMFLMTKTIIPLMKKNKFGRIINISSTAGQRGEPFHSHYAASKGAMISYTKSLAAELGKYNITVNSIAPGWVDTEMCKGVFSNKKYKEKVRLEIPVQRIASAEDIAGPVLFLASDLARHINGEILNVNGGSVLCG
ncbi:MAG: alcohol dehydrogenase [Ignavibacteria bacterium RIFOXYB2_FULL_35_12]|nr:MAG: alcohol dehydrogenase [Ignavibacteria bacterium GWA2_36_19]OGU61307.1 MAG: alcohol dehydrogenase [Ignavibacteria bacterium GWF2_35_20]OGU88482.1 MAG: alcohol dehydrogenase [Ignavibacteria bacterium RIFOXYA12_FULL_35_25]OGU92433.1 MAG: alcohol dehydrogenase [Ignavibacteria bacterium RIFOXYC12_FULL_35_11]OGU95810.1 MAG: alcohol dehydrogenase [Ignavibacteria bacterium RIFOXYB12_FULL_35_14]OGV00952.1 MAG: alcohol dehydrogenase [Ignavibacteria bacterium RIFOXYC2_FULL_35_16]OGV05444.1 MAG: 